MTVNFVVFGEPYGKGRPKFSTANNKFRTYTPAKTESYEALIRTEYRIQCRDKFFDKFVPLQISIRSFCSIPKNTSKKKRSLMNQGIIRPIKKPDNDNVEKTICDALNKVAYYDDSQIVDSCVSKYYSERPRIEVTIRDYRKDREDMEE